jgi:putative transposase
MYKNEKTSNINSDYSIYNVAVENMLNEIQKGNNPTAAEILQTTMNLLMLAERNLHLDGKTADKGNGYFNRELGTPMGKIDLRVPRDRNGDFRPAILPAPHQRDYRERDEFLESLFLNGYSPNNIRQTLNFLDLHYNPKELDQLKDRYYELFQKWQNRQLPEDVVGLFIDVYHSETNIDGKVCKSALYVIVGIDFNGQKDLFGLYLYEGNETKGFWLQTLNQLIDRGLKRPLIIASDDFPGLKDAIKTLFPNALHQLCFIHMQRNVRRNMGTDDAKTFNETLKQIRLMKKQEECTKQFTSLCENYQQQYPDFIKGLLDDTQNYFAFKHLPSEVQKHFYTTNIVESVNSTIEKLRIKMGGFFQSKETLYLNVFLAVRALGQRKWHKGVPMIKANLYYLRQLFAQRYNELPKLQI